MKVDGVSPGINIVERRDQQSLPTRIEGRLTLDRNGQLMLQTQDDEAFPVRLMGIDLPLGTPMTFELVGREGMSLIYSAGMDLPETPRFESLLKSWGMETNSSLQDLMKALYQEELPLTKDNVLTLERNLRLIRQEWGVQINPQILAKMMAKNLPVRPHTVLAMLFRTFPELRREIAKAVGVQPAEVITKSAEAIKETLQNIKEQTHSSDDHNINQINQAFLGTVVCRTDDQGEIHWPADDSPADTKDHAEKFGFDLIPTHIGLVQVDVEWAQEGSRVTLTVEPEYLKMFEEAIPAWQQVLLEQGIVIAATAKAAHKQSTDLPPRVDWRA